MGSENESAVTPLVPGPSDTTRLSSIEIVRRIREEADSPGFAEECDRLIGEFRDGDVALEFCSSLQNWNQEMGQAGSLLLRNGRNVISLVTRLSSPPFSATLSTLSRLP
jgi:hypothetical protein